MAIELFHNGKHVCLMFSDRAEDGHDRPVQSNQFLIVCEGNGILLDPGGTLTYKDLYMAIARFFPPRRLLYVFASHADPDIIASLPRWLNGLETRLLISRIWSRFVPHFLHAEGNLQFYDPVSRILFSGDMGASLLSTAGTMAPVKAFQAHVRHMQDFHVRYMVSDKVCRYWAGMVRKFDPEWIVPQHGLPFNEGALIVGFLDWVENLACDVDLMTYAQHRLPVEVGLPPAFLVQPG